jgi:hypothetical protein
MSGPITTGLVMLALLHHVVTSRLEARHRWIVTALFAPFAAFAVFFAGVLVVAWLRPGWLPAS